jgi:quinol-cytochrome oxidoreductase complex cytochrome b subunit
MNASEFFEFIFPQYDLLQISFLVLILSMMVLAVVTTHIYANSVHWEKKWNGNTPDDHQDDLDIDHGSVTDIWNAVATAPEKLAEIMPGMLLVVGLLLIRPCEFLSSIFDVSVLEVGDDTFRGLL